MTFALIQLLVGLVLLWLGAEGLVRGAASLALRLGLAPLVVGLTVVAFGTSAPELAVSVRAALAGTGALAVGNVIGSNISNIALILGLSAVITPLAVHAQVIRIDIPLMILASVLAYALCADGALLRWEGALLAGALAAYLGFSVVAARREAASAVSSEFEQEIPQPGRHPLLEAAMVAGGIAVLVAGADWLVSGAVTIARALGASDAVIGLTMVALGTSLPELATSVVAALRRHTDLAVGNIIGSNLFNLLGILGIAALFAPMRIEGIGLSDWLVMLAVALLILPLARSDFTVRRWEGVLLVGIYVVYIGQLALRA